MTNKNQSAVDRSPVPAAACNRCGGWTGFGGMSQYATSLTKVLGRTGCTCYSHGNVLGLAVAQ